MGKNRLGFFGGVGLAAGLALATGAAAQGGGAATAPAAAAPFVMTQELTAFSQGVAASKAGLTTWSDGRGDTATRTLLYSAPADAAPAAVAFPLRRVELADGEVALISDDLQLKSGGVPLGTAPAAASPRTQSPNCALTGETVLGKTTLAGESAVETAGSLGGSALERVLAWRLPAFQCVEVAYTMQSRASAASAWQTTAEMKLVSFSAAAPDAAIFADWSGYKEVKPSDLMRAAFAKMGCACAMQLAAAGPLDAQYASWRH